MTKLIRQINFPADLRKFDKDQLKQISDELRDELLMSFLKLVDILVLGWG